MEYEKDLIPRILRDINDGVIALDKQGRIIYINPQCRKLLNLSKDDIGKTYFEVFFSPEQNKDNDSFHQLLIDAIYKKEQSHNGSVSFIDKDNKKIYLRVTSSFLKSEDSNDFCGVVLVLADVTDTEIYKKKKNDATVVFFCVTACVCLYLLLLSTLEFFKVNVSTKILTQVINAMVFVIGVIIYKKTDFTSEDLGLKIHNYKETFICAGVISVSIVLVLVLFKLIILRIYPEFFSEGIPFWNWNIGLYSWISYVFTSIIQEFLARSMIYGSIRKIFDGKKGFIASVILSSLLFGAVHVAHGFLYMVAAMILLGLLGGLYEKQRNIWGVTIIHYILGQAACCLGFLS
jgi:PAS domain S-box-containing protein